MAAMGIAAFAGGANAGGPGENVAKSGDRDTKQEAKARFVSGQSHYNLNEFAEALIDFKEAYRLLPDPVFLYNLGQCERQLGHPEEAILFYRSFLREQPKAPNRQDVVHKIEEMETTLKAKQAETDKDTTPIAEPGSAMPGANVATEAKPAVVPSDLNQPTSPTGMPMPEPAGAPSATNVAVTPSSPSSAEPNPTIPTAAPPARPEIQEGVTNRIDLAATPATPAASQSPAFYSHWWFWTATGVVVAGTAVGIYAATADRAPSAPNSTLGSKRVF
jgi:hypothetical protein